MLLTRLQMEAPLTEVDAREFPTFPPAHSTEVDFRMKEKFPATCS